MASSKSKGAKAQKMKKSDVELVEAIIDKMRELVDYYPKVRAFYEGKRPANREEFISRRMVVRNSLMLNCERLVIFQVESFCPAEAGAQVVSRLNDGIASLTDVFAAILGDECPSVDFVRGFAPYQVEDRGREYRIANLYWWLVMVQMDVFERELQIWREHPEWPLESACQDDCCVIIGRKDLARACDAIKKFKQKHPGLALKTAAVFRRIRTPWADFPSAFAEKSTCGEVMIRYDCLLADVLSASESIYTQSVAGYLGDYAMELNEWIWRVLLLLHKYFVKRGASGANDVCQRWIEADAELVSHFSAEGTIDKTDADKIIGLANKAAKAEWVARRMANGYDDVKIEFPRPGERQAQSVRLDEGQLAALVAAREVGRRDTKRIIGEVRKAAAGSDGGCHHRDKAKDKVVQAVIRHLAKPGVVFSIHNACEKVGGRRNASWLYSWCHDHEDEIHAQVDILRNAESAFRS